MGEWLIGRWAPVSLFSLRMTLATSKGGKTLLVPTPYAVKMALIDACFRREWDGEALMRARQVFDLIKEREVRMRPPAECVVQNTFIKILDHERDGDLPYKSTIAYREFVFYQGVLEVAVGVGGLAAPDSEMLTELFAHVQSFGKRGSFWQFLEAKRHKGDLPVGFTVPVTEAVWRGIASYGTVQPLDDFGEALCADREGFERISTYGDKPLTLNKHRVLASTAIPYRLRAAGRHFTWYTRLDGKGPVDPGGR